MWLSICTNNNIFIIKDLLRYIKITQHFVLRNFFVVRYYHVHLKPLSSLSSLYLPDVRSTPWVLTIKSGHWPVSPENPCISSDSREKERTTGSKHQSLALTSNLPSAKLSYFINASELTKKQNLLYNLMWYLSSCYNNKA